MKLTLIITLLTSLLFISCINGQEKKDTIDDFEYTYEYAHPKAQALMKDSFYWSPIVETAPFGSDDGWEAAYGFREWRILNKTKSPVAYLEGLIESWQYPFFDYTEMDTTKILKYINQSKKLTETELQQQIDLLKEVNQISRDTSAKNLTDEQLREVVLTSLKGLNGIFLLGQDNAIIGIAFAQFVLEGRIDKDIRALAITAIERQLLPILLNRYDLGHQDMRKHQLTKMLQVINKAG